MDKNRGNKMTVKLVSNEKIAETSSKGNQEKWYDKETNKWYKLDQFGYEALAETLISKLFQIVNIFFLQRKRICYVRHGSDPHAVFFCKISNGKTECSWQGQNRLLK